MSYTEAQIRQLVDTLTNSQLKDLCQDEFPSVYSDFHGKSRSEQNRDLTEYVSKQGQAKVNILLDRIKAINSDGYNNVINSFGFKEFQLYNLDLIPPVRNCLKEISRRRGLICFSFSCSHQSFITSFSERLEQELVKGTDVIRDKTIWHVKSKHKKITLIATEIGDQRKKLKNDNIGIFCVNIDECKRTEDITIFLNKVQKSFEEIVDFCSIIILFKDDDFSYPSNVICNYPKVEYYDFCNWIKILMKKDNGKWKDAGESWKNMVIEKLTLDKEKNEDLDLVLLYEHLTYILRYLTNNPQVLPGEFSKKVKDNLEQLTEEEE